MSWKLLILPFVSLLISQLLKLMFNRAQRDLSAKGIFTSYGGMPSSHAAFVASVAVLAGLYSGWLSPVFAVALVFSVLVVRDAVGLRQEISKQNQRLNYLTAKLLPEEKRRLTGLDERIGHTFREVIIGCLVGIFISIIGYLLL